MALRNRHLDVDCAATKNGCSSYLQIVSLVSLIIICIAALSSCHKSGPEYQLIPAVMQGDVDKVVMLLDGPSGVDVNWKAGGYGESALGTAAAYNQISIVRLLLDRGADPNISNERGETPLLAAAYGGHSDVVKVLNEAGANVDVAETRHGFTPLALAAREGHVVIVRLLLREGASLATKTADGRTPLELARQYGHADVVRELSAYREE